MHIVVLSLLPDELAYVFFEVLHERSLVGQLLDVRIGLDHVTFIIGNSRFFFSSSNVLSRKNAVARLRNSFSSGTSGFARYRNPRELLVVFFALLDEFGALIHQLP